VKQQTFGNLDVKSLLPLLSREPVVIREAVLGDITMGGGCKGTWQEWVGCVTEGVTEGHGESDWGVLRGQGQIRSFRGPSPQLSALAGLMLSAG
jgi:hypothetical protein